MGCRSHDVGILHGVVEQTGSDKTGRVSHVNHKESANLVGNLAHALVVPFAAISRTTTDDELWLVLDGESFHLVVIYTTSFLVEVVAYRTIQNTRSVYGRTV